MHSFLSDKSLTQLITSSALPEEMKQQYIELLPKLNEQGRAYLVDMIADSEIVQDAQTESSQAIQHFKQFSQDNDYDKLRQSLDK